MTEALKETSELFKDEPDDVISVGAKLKKAYGFFENTCEAQKGRLSTLAGTENICDKGLTEQAGRIVKEVKQKENEFKTTLKSYPWVFVCVRLSV